MPPVVIQRKLREGLLHVLNVAPSFTPTSYAAVSSVTRDARNTGRIAQSAARHLRDRFDASLASLSPMYGIAASHQPFSFTGRRDLMF